jgi:hypothetical protein
MTPRNEERPTSEARANERSADAGRRVVEEADQASQAAAQETAAAAQETRAAAADLAKSNAEAMQKTVESGMAIATDVAQRSFGQFAETLGLAGRGSEQTAQQTASNTQAIMKCGTVLARATQDLSGELLDETRDRIRKNIEGMNSLLRARTPQDAFAIQSGLVRENMETMVHQSRRIAERMLSAADQAMGEIRAQAQPRH